MNLPVSLGASLAQRLKEPFTVLVIAENVLAPVTPVHDVVNGAFILDSEFPGHRPESWNHGDYLSILRTDPFSDDPKSIDEMTGSNAAAKQKLSSSDF